MKNEKKQNQDNDRFLVETIEESGVIRVTDKQHPWRDPMDFPLATVQQDLALVASVGYHAKHGELK